MVDNEGVPKGLRRVLVERGLWRNRLRLECKTGEHKEDNRCCCKRLLGCQPDFLEQRSLLAEICESHGADSIFLPKYHCELNVIEFFWGQAKRYTRDNCQYDFNGLLETVPKAFKTIDVLKMRRWEQRTFRWMDGYERGMGAAEADEFQKSLSARAQRDYTLHRRVGAERDQMDAYIDHSSEMYRGDLGTLSGQFLLHISTCLAGPLRLSCIHMNVQPASSCTPGCGRLYTPPGCLS
jgi:hypothetical protein